MLKTLIRKQLLELFHTYVIDKKTGKVRSKFSIAMYILLAVVLFGGLGFAFYSMAGGLGITILSSGLNWLYFALMGLLSMALGVFGSVFNTYAGLYLPKDNELLMALPIPPRKLLLARTAGVYVTSLMYSAWVWIPSVIAYWVLVPANCANVIFPILLTFVIALFVSVLSCLLGWIVAIIASKAKGKSFLTVFLSLFVMAAYYVVYFKIINSLGEIVTHLDSIGQNVRSWLHYVYLLGQAADGNALSMLLVTLITVLLAAVCLFVLSKTFTRIALAGGKAEKRTGKALDYTPVSRKRLLLNRELKHFTSVPTWMLNGGLGLLLLPAAAVALLIKSDAVRSVFSEICAELPDIGAAMPVFLLAFACIFVSMNCILPVSVSMEGKSMWLLQSLPVDFREVLRAKERMDVMLNVYPTLLSVLAVGIVFQLSAAQLVLTAVCAWIFIWLTADFGLMLNLRHPDLDWTDMAAVMKRSPAVMIQLFGGWLFCAVLGFGGFFLCRIAGAVPVLIGIGLLFCALWFLLHRWLMNKGAGILRTL
ncbi:MAG: hypothetical protein MJ118_02975 [Clostridia bacterium]|nr:hypothetical protein [Clostridia bacterium]